VGDKVRWATKLGGREKLGGRQSLVGECLVVDKMLSGGQNVPSPTNG
jgi:hypothetical protein